MTINHKLIQYAVNLYKKDAVTKIISEKLSLTCEKVENSTLESAYLSITATKIVNFFSRTVYVSGDKKKILTLRKANNIECEIVKGDWVYKIRHTSGTLSMQVNKDEPFEAFCAKPSECFERIIKTMQQQKLQKLHPLTGASAESRP